MLLTSVRSYRLEAFREAAVRFGVEVITAVDLPPQLADQWPEALALDFADLQTASDSIVAFATERPIKAILAVDDSGSLLAAEASARLGLQHNSADAALAARDKAVMRHMLHRSGVQSPRFARFSLSEDAAAIAQMVSFPCVVKPLNLNGSRGVIRANDTAELAGALNRLGRMLLPADGAMPQILIEDYIPGIEVAVEGLLENGKLRILALFDKPDPLEGPYFEETIYVTPSRLSPAEQKTVFVATAEAASALGMTTGPVHAELRMNDLGPWIVEIAGRSIGGLCSQVLRFGIDGSLEEMIIRQATGMPLNRPDENGQASGVMMIPVPAEGLLRRISGVEEASAVPLIEKVEITARENYPMVPLPEGDSYPGFIFARGDSPAAVESALREAHAKLHFEVEPIMALQPR